MNAKALAIAAAVALLVPAGSGRSQDAEPADEKKPKGLLGALSGSEDPSAKRRPDVLEAPTTEPGTEASKRGDAHVVRSAPDPQRLAERIRQLESVRYADIEPVSPGSASTACAGVRSCSAAAPTRILSGR
jgi:hypothetical protein